MKYHAKQSASFRSCFYESRRAECDILSINNGNYSLSDVADGAANVLRGRILVGNVSHWRNKHRRSARLGGDLFFGGGASGVGSEEV